MIFPPKLRVTSLWTNVSPEATESICVVLIFEISIVLSINEPLKLLVENVKVISFGDVVVKLFKYLLVVPWIKSLVVFVARSALNNDVA